MPSMKSPTTARSCCFIEIENSQSEEDPLPEWIDCYVISNIDPKYCGPLTRDLNAILPLRIPDTSRSSSADGMPPPSPGADELEVDGNNFPRTDHLKRIRRRPATADEISSRATKPETIQVKSSNTEATPDNNKKISNNDNEANKRKTTNASTDTDEPPLKHPKANSNEGEGSDFKSITKNETTNNGHPNKRSKTKKKNKQQHSTPWSLDILVGSVAAVDHHLIETTDSKSSTQSSLESILKKYNLSPQSPNYIRRSLPGRPANTKDELEQWNKTIWHTSFHEERTAQYKEEQMALTVEEISMMKKGMDEALKDGLVGKQQWMEWSDRLGNVVEPSSMPCIAGVIVMDPLNGSIVSRASEERQMQGVMSETTYYSDGAKQQPNVEKKLLKQSPHDWSSFPDEANPLCTSVLLAIQGVSRTERQIALGCGMGSDKFRSGQYLCTSYDVYLTKEPNIYEAMALVHSRVRRVVFGVSDDGMGGLGGAADAIERQNTGIHSLPGTNHHYRAFRLDLGGVNDCEEEVVTLMESLKKIHNDDCSA